MPERDQDPGQVRGQGQPDRRQTYLGPSSLSQAVNERVACLPGKRAMKSHEKARGDGERLEVVCAGWWVAEAERKEQVKRKLLKCGSCTLSSPCRLGTVISCPFVAEISGSSPGASAGVVGCY